MKYPRNTRIFRGQLDVAPVASLFFITAILLFLHSQIVFTPGVRLDLQPSSQTNRPSLYIDAQNLFHFGGSTMSQQTFERRLREESENGKLPATLILQTDPAASTDAVNKVREMAVALSFAIEPPGTRIELPEISDQPGVSGPSVVVAVNLNGQYFYENQLVRRREDLEARLIQAAKEAREPMTLILRMDKDVAVDTLVQLSEMARKAGFRDAIIGTRPALKPVPGNTN